VGDEGDRGVRMSSKGRERREILTFGWTSGGRWTGTGSLGLSALGDYVAVPLGAERPRSYDTPIPKLLLPPG
jgi:hypothetical protein